MNQPLDVQILQFDKQAKTGHRADDPVELRPDMLLQVLTLEPGVDLACGLVRTPLGHGTVFAVDDHGVDIVGKYLFGGDGLRPLYFQHTFATAATANEMPYTPMHQ